MSNIKTQKSIEPTLNNYLDLVFGELNEKEYMVVEAHGIPNEQKICNSKNEIIDFLSRYYYDHNIFVALATSKGENRKEENLYATSVLAFDFDKKDHPGLSVEKLRKMVYEKCGLFMSMIVDSGHGYHVYVQVKKTNDIARWNRITKEFAGIIGAGLAGMLTYAVFTLFANYSSLFGLLNLNVWYFLLIGLVCGLFNMLGDTFSSYFKRRAVVKDFSNLIPGHGGVMDRINGLVVNSFCVFAILLVLFA